MTNVFEERVVVVPTRSTKEAEDEIKERFPGAVITNIDKVEDGFKVFYIEGRPTKEDFEKEFGAV